MRLIKLKLGWSTLVFEDTPANRAAALAMLDVELLTDVKRSPDSNWDDVVWCRFDAPDRKISFIDGTVHQGTAEHYQNTDPDYVVAASLAAGNDG